MKNVKTELLVTYGVIEGGWRPGEFRNPAALATDVQGLIAILTVESPICETPAKGEGSFSTLG